MKRRLLNLLTVVSLAMFVMVVVLWVRGHSHQDHIGWGFWGNDAHVPESKERWFAGIEGCSGVLAIGALREREGDPARGPLVRTASGFFWNDHGWPLNMFIVAAFDSAGFAFLWLDYDPTPGHLGHHGVVICVPFWFAAMITAVPPLAWIGQRHRSMRRQRRKTLRLCPSCGYDIRATPDRCPECGEHVESEPPRIDYRRPSQGTNRSVRTGLVVLGITLILAGAAFAAFFKVAVVTPAYTPLPGGGYGETYGPVSMLRVPVYVLCGSLVVVGIACVGLGARIASRRRG